MSDNIPSINVIGGGLAGTEAAWQAANRGMHVTLFEMRPRKMTPAHTTGRLAELVCSNSLGADQVDQAPGLLKHEMRALGLADDRMRGESRRCRPAARWPSIATSSRRWSPRRSSRTPTSK